MTEEEQRELEYMEEQAEIERQWDESRNEIYDMLQEYVKTYKDDENFIRQLNEALYSVTQRSVVDIDCIDEETALMIAAIVQYINDYNKWPKKYRM